MPQPSRPRLLSAAKVDKGKLDESVGDDTPSPDSKHMPELKADSSTTPQNNVQSAEDRVDNSDGSPKKKNRFAERMAAKLQPAMAATLQQASVKYKQVKSSGAKASTSMKVETMDIDTTNPDEGTLGDGIPSVIETFSTSTIRKDRESDSDTTALKSEDKHQLSCTDSSLPNNNNQAGEQSEQLDICEEEGSVLTCDKNKDDEVVNAVNAQQSNESNINKDVKKDGNSSSVTDDEILAACAPNGEHHSDGDLVDDDLVLQQPNPSPTDSAARHLEKLLAIQFDLVTVRAENDEYKMLLKAVEAERDMYKEKCEKYERIQRGFHSLKSPFNKKGISHH